MTIKEKTIDGVMVATGCSDTESHYALIANNNQLSDAIKCVRSGDIKKIRHATLTIEYLVHDNDAIYTEDITDALMKAGALAILRVTT